MTNVVILGGGPAGLGAAFKLAQSGRARVTVLEQRDHVGRILVIGVTGREAELQETRQRVHSAVE